MELPPFPTPKITREQIDDLLVLSEELKAIQDKLQADAWAALGEALKQSATYDLKPRGTNRQPPKKKRKNR